MNLRTALLTTAYPRSPAILAAALRPANPFSHAADMVEKHMGAQWVVKPLAPPLDVPLEEYVAVMRAMKLAAYAARIKPADVPPDFADAADIREVLGNPGAYRPEYVALIRAMRQKPT